MPVIINPPNERIFSLVQQLSITKQQATEMYHFFYFYLQKMTRNETRLLLMGQKARSSGLDPLGNRAVAKHGDKKFLKVRRGIINKPVSILHGHCPLQLCDAKTLEFVGSVKPIEDNSQVKAVTADSKMLNLVELLET